MVDVFRTVLQIVGEDLTGRAFASATRNAEKSARDARRALADANREVRRFQNTNTEGNTRVQRALGSVSSELSRMVLRYGSVAVAAEAARRAFLGFAETDKAIRNLAVQFDRPVEELEKLIPLFKDWEGVSGRTFDEITSGFDRLQQSGRLSLEQTKKAFPAILQLAVTSNAQLDDVARTAGSIFLQMGIGVEHADKAMGMLNASHKMFGIEVQQMLRWGPQLIDQMVQWGYTGEEGLARMLAYLGAINKVTGNTQKSSQNLLQTFNSLNVKEVADRVNRTQDQMLRYFNEVQKRGGDVLAAWVKEVDKAILRDADLLKKLPLHVRQTYTALKDEQDKMGENIDKLREKTTGLADDMSKATGGPWTQWNQMVTQLGHLADEFGSLLSLLSGPGMENITVMVMGLSKAIHGLVELLKMLGNIPGMKTLGTIVGLPGKIMQGMEFGSGIEKWKELFQDWGILSKERQNELIKQLEQSVDQTTNLTKELRELNNTLKPPTAGRGAGTGGGSSVGTGMPRGYPGSTGTGVGTGVPSVYNPQAPKLNLNKMQVASTVSSTAQSLGANPSTIAGLLHGAREESNFNPSTRHPDQPKWGGEAHFAHGLWSEGGAEWNNYARWLQQNYPGADWRDPKLQTEFTIHRLKTGYPKVWAQMQAGNKEQAADAFLRGYLKPRRDLLEQRSQAIRRRGVPSASQYVPRGTTPNTGGGTAQASEAPASFNDRFNAMGAPSSANQQLQQYLEMRKMMEKPITMRFERDPGEIQFMRTTYARQFDREVRLARWGGYADIGAA